MLTPIGIDFATRIGWWRIWAIARLSWKEAVRGRVIWVFGTMALVSPFMQNNIGYPVTTAGWLLGTRGIGTLLSMMVISRLLSFIEARWLLLIGLIMMAGTSRLPEQRSRWRA